MSLQFIRMLPPLLFCCFNIMVGEFSIFRKGFADFANTPVKTEALCVTTAAASQFHGFMQTSYTFHHPSESYPIQSPVVLLLLLAGDQCLLRFLKAFLPGMH
jgi:hypothetical protein